MRSGLHARRLAALNASFPLNTFGARMHRPDLPGWRKQIWVDSMDVDAPFLLKLGSITNDESYVDQGLNELLGYARALQVESNNETDGLFWHGYEEDCGTNGKLWARGNGWAGPWARRICFCFGNKYAKVFYV